MSGTEPEMSRMERQPMLKNLHKFKIEKEEKISKNGRLEGRGRRKLLKTRERTMFPKLNMMGDMKMMRMGS